MLWPQTGPNLRQVEIFLRINVIAINYRLGYSLSSVLHLGWLIRRKVQHLTRPLRGWSKGMTMEELKNEIIEMKGLHGKLAIKVDKHEERMTKLEKEVGFLSKKIRERNVIIHGITFNKPGYRGLTMEDKTEKWFNDTLELDLTIEMAYYMTNKSKKNKSLFVGLMTVGNRNKIFAKGVLSKLKGTNISIQEDLPKEVREARKLWMPTWIKLKNEGKKVQFRGTQLFCDGKLVAEKLKIKAREEVMSAEDSESEEDEQDGDSKEEDNGSDS